MKSERRGAAAGEREGKVREGGWRGGLPKKTMEEIAPNDALAAD